MDLRRAAASAEAVIEEINHHLHEIGGAVEEAMLVESQWGVSLVEFA